VTLTFVPVRSLDAVRRARPNGAQFDATFGGVTPAMAYVFCGEAKEPGNHFHARMFAPALGIPEDPATGAAVAAFAGMLAAFGGLPDGQHDLRIEQGYEMGRPSLIELGLEKAKDALAGATIGGHAVIVSEGTIEV
jgi:trans-2,3-dihydro-3-hydroxyanthranilate isomerase